MANSAIDLSLFESKESGEEERKVYLGFTCPAAGQQDHREGLDCRTTMLMINPTPQNTIKRADRKFPRACFLALRGPGAPFSGSCCIGAAPPEEVWIGTLRSVTFVSGSAKRTAVLKAKSATLPDTKEKLLSGLCEIRWVETNASVRFFDTYLTVVDSLIEISDWQDHTTSSKAEQFLTAVQSHNLIVALHILARFSGQLLPVSAALQIPNTDLLESIEQIEKIKQKKQENRDKAEEHFMNFS
ncbi:hypothetical protein NDU88_006904 [Pleurodeles waltl]|uniref:Uncharacterized protein n=1 Tax=Pleurodeles waltl TaxID=8319 RepID=A0AAV7UMD7_PLEWA|nr:hypothetical protein NDU88_006904 [Pleurodeles waltl]